MLHAQGIIFLLTIYGKIYSNIVIAIMVDTSAEDLHINFFMSSLAYSVGHLLYQENMTGILYNKEGKPSVAESSAFTDVAPGEWYSNAVTWAAASNIVGGYGNGLFGPGDNITREQLAVMLWRYAGESAAANKELHFNDADEASGYALDALRWAVENGIINGKGGGILDPRGQTTRAQIAQMLMNYLRK